MKAVKMKFEVEVLVPVDTKEKEEGLKEVAEKEMKVFGSDEEKEIIAKEIAEVLGLEDDDNYGIKIINESYKIIEA